MREPSRGYKLFISAALFMTGVFWVLMMSIQIFMGNLGVQQFEDGVLIIGFGFALMGLGGICYHGVKKGKM